LADPLPKLVDIRKLIAQGVELRASEPLRHFTRLCEMLESPAGESEQGAVDIGLNCFIDEQGKRRIDGHVQADVWIPCQRCLQPMMHHIESSFSVAAVWTDEEAEHLPKHLDPFVVGEGPQDLRELIEDELIISLPYVSYHELDACVATPHLQTGAAEVAAAEAVEPAQKENPFRVLEKLKPGK
jgi:uncharacterized protein